MSVKRSLFLFSAALAASFVGNAQPEVILGLEENASTPETHQLMWETTPGIRYLLEESTTLGAGSWSPVAGFPTEAAARAQAHKFSVGNTPRKFFRISEIDGQAPTVNFLSPADDSFGVGRFSDITIDLDDATGINRSSIQLTVGAHRPYRVSDSQLTLGAGDVLTFDLGDDTAIGAWGEEITVSLVVADTVGNSATHTWTFELEVEPSVASGVFVFGSPNARRAGQGLSGAAATIASRFHSGPVRMNSGASGWQMHSVTETTVVLTYTATAPTSFAANGLITNLAPSHLDEIFYRRITSVSDDATNKRLTLTTEDAELADFLLTSSYNLDEDALFLQMDDQGNITRATTLDAVFELPAIGADFLKDTPPGQSRTLWNDGALSLSVREAKAVFTPSLRVNFETSRGDLERFQAEIDGDITVSLMPEFTVSGAYSGVETIPLWSYRHIIWTAVGVVPVAIEVNASIDVVADLDVNADATLRSGFRQEVNMGVSGLYKKDASPAVTWDRWFHPKPTYYEPLGYTTNGNAEASLALVGQIDVRLHAAAGIYINVDPRVEARGSATLTNGELTSASWVTGAYADLNAGLSVIGFENSDLPALPSLRLFTKEWGSRYPKAASLAILNQPQSSAAQLGETINLTVEAVGAGNLSYAWYQNRNRLLANRNQLIISDFKSADAGDYHVVVSDDANQLTSETARVSQARLSSAQYYSGTGHNYLFVPGRVTWTQARRAAESLGGHLATIHSDGENRFVANLIPGDADSGTAWTGLYQSASGSEPSGGWRWITGEPLSYTKWNSGEPNQYQGIEEDWGSIFSYSYKSYYGAWNDLAIDNRDATGYVVEFSKAAGQYMAPEDRLDWTVSLGGGADLKLKWIAPGNFQMGSPSGESARDSDEGPVHRVTLSQGYWLGQREVTQAQWQAVMGNNPSRFKGAQNPVEKVTWSEAMEFCRKLTERERRAGRLPAGMAYTLPTEAQWEYACRARTTGPIHYGNRLDGRMANFNGNHPYGGASTGEYRKKTVAVGSFRSNAWGLYDMHGNVWEWCSDWSGDYPSGSVVDPTGASSGSYRICRGGSWSNNARYCRSANRYRNAPGYRWYNLGFRLSLSSVH